MAIPWQDRQRQAALTTPDGTRFEFLYEDVDRNRSENASVFRFAEKSGALIKRLSSGEDIYPLSLIFSGPDYDIIAEDFWQKTKVPGVFLLEHPRFKGLLRVQLLTIRQRIAAKSGDNQSIFDVVLHETLELTAPLTTEDETAKVLEAAEETNKQAAEAFAGNAVLDKPGKLARLQARLNKFLDSANDKFKAIAAKEAAIKAAFDAQYLSAKSALDKVLEKPLELANNVTVFMSTVSRVRIDVRERIAQYKSLADETLNELQRDIIDPLEDAKNKAIEAVLTLHSIVSGMGQSAVSAAIYQTRAEVIAVIDEIVDIADATIELTDEYSDSFNEEVDPADRRYEITDAVNTVNELTSLVTAQLFAIAFTLKQERIITLDKDRDLYTLTHELYGFTEENLALLIETNQIKGDKLFIVPQGTEIVYYI